MTHANTPNRERPNRRRRRRPTLALVHHTCCAAHCAPLLCVVYKHAQRPIRRKHSIIRPRRGLRWYCAKTHISDCAGCARLTAIIVCCMRVCSVAHAKWIRLIDERVEHIIIICCAERLTSSSSSFVPSCCCCGDAAIDQCLRYKSACV